MKHGPDGDYSACVGASMMALKELRAKNLKQCTEWSERALKHFDAFQAGHPGWFNINYFAAQALACLGRYEEGLQTFKAMYQKQNNSEKPEEVQAFLTLSAEIKSLRESLRGPV